MQHRNDECCWAELSSLWHLNLNNMRYCMRNGSCRSHVITREFQTDPSVVLYQWITSLKYRFHGIQHSWCWCRTFWEHYVIHRSDGMDCVVRAVEMSNYLRDVMTNISQKIYFIFTHKCAASKPLTTRSFSRPNYRLSGAGLSDPVNTDSVKILWQLPLGPLILMI